MTMFNVFKNRLFKGVGIIILFVISVIVFNSYNIGPFTVRVYATIAMSLYLLYNGIAFGRRQSIPITNSYIKLYAAFLGIFLLCLIANGEITEFDYFKRLFAYHVVCFVAFYAIYLKVNDRDQILLISVSLLAIIFANSVITVLQASGNSLAWAIGERLSPIEEVEDQANNYDTIVGISIISGIFGDVVRNAYYLTSLVPLTIFLFKHNKFLVRFFAIIIYIIGLLAIFFTQQRAAFYIFVFVLMLYLLATSVKKPIYWALSILVLFFSWSYIESFFSDFDFGRLLNTDNSDRIYIWKVAYDFVPDHIFWGGPVEFQRKAGLSAHNLFFDSIIFSGIGGFITLMIFTIKIGLMCAKTTVEYIKNRCSLMTFSLAMSMTACTLYGFTHNTSVLTGEVIVFILLSLLLKSIQLDQIQK